MTFKVLITTSLSRTYGDTCSVHGNSIIAEFDTEEEAVKAVKKAPTNSKDYGDQVRVTAVLLNPTR